MNLFKCKHISQNPLPPPTKSIQPPRLPLPHSDMSKHFVTSTWPWENRAFIWFVHQWFVIFVKKGIFKKPHAEDIDQNCQVSTKTGWWRQVSHQSGVRALHMMAPARENLGTLSFHDFSQHETVLSQCLVNGMAERFWSLFCIIRILESSVPLRGASF